MHRLIRPHGRTGAVAMAVAAWLAGALGLGLATGAGAVPTATLMALGPLLGGLLLLIGHHLVLADRIGNLANLTTRTFDTARRVESGTTRELKDTFRQLEALQNLHAVLPTSNVLPATRGWAASPDLLMVLVDLMITERPSLVVECGSGASTLWLALAMRRFGIDGRVIALDHDPVFAGKTRDFLAMHDVCDLAEVRDAPLESYSLGGETYPWYARKAWEGLTGIGLLFVDGPPAEHRPRGPLSGAAVARPGAAPRRHRRPRRPRGTRHAAGAAALAGRVPGLRLGTAAAGETGSGAARVPGGPPPCGPGPSRSNPAVPR